MQGLRNNMKLAKGESELQVGNGARVAVVAIWTYVLNLPNDFCLNLDGCFDGLALKRTFDIIYASSTLINGINILDMTNPILNVNDNKRPKGDNTKSSYF